MVPVMCGGGWVFEVQETKDSDPVLFDGTGPWLPCVRRYFELLSDVSS